MQQPKNVLVVDAPTSFVKQLGGVCKGVKKYKDLPQEVRDRALPYWDYRRDLYWSKASHSSSSVLPHVNECVMAVLLVGRRLDVAAAAFATATAAPAPVTALDSMTMVVDARAAVANEGGTGASNSCVCAGAAGKGELMYLPVEMWLHILSFISKLDLGKL